MKNIVVVDPKDVTVTVKENKYLRLTKTHPQANHRVTIYKVLDMKNNELHVCSSLSGATFGMALSYMAGYTKACEVFEQGEDLAVANG